MKTFSSMFKLSTRGFSDIHDITRNVESALSHSGTANGIATVFVPGSTAAVTSIEFEPGVLEDLRSAIDRIAPTDIPYRHDARWGDGNGFAHVRAALVGPSMSIPIRNGALTLGTWQQIILIDFDNRPRSREVHVQIVGD